MIHNSTSPLAGKVAMVTGASKGIGKAIAFALADQGARLTVVARSEEIDEVAKELAARTETIAGRCDVACRESVAAIVDQTLKRWGRIDVLVNAAGVLGATGAFWETDEKEWDSAIDVNLRGSYHTMRYVLPSMIAARSGKVINFAGGGAAYGYPRFSAYAASKAAIVRLTETVALECAPFDVQANAVAPGAIETDMLRAVRAAGGEVRTTSTMDKVIELISFLSSSASDHISGRFIHARDEYRNWNGDLNADMYTLRRVQP